MSNDDSPSLLRRRRSPTIVADTAASIRDSISENYSSLKSSVTLTWHEIPEWMKDNEYIITGYRRAQNNWHGVLQSLFAYVHNETVNVHSHLWAGVLFLFLLVTAYSTQISQYATATWRDHSNFVIFLAAATFCLSCSAAFHLALCHSKTMARRFSNLDYCGIVVLIVGSFYPSLYYGFFCDTWWQVLYLSGITLAGCGTMVIVFAPRFSLPEYRSLRATVFASLGLFGVLPFSHLLFTQGLKQLHNLGFSWLFLSGVLYLLGAFIYANRFPERWFPGKFDYFFASHQIFHFHVVLAALAHYACVLKAFHHWHGVLGGTCAAPL